MLRTKSVSSVVLDFVSKVGVGQPATHGGRDVHDFPKLLIQSSKNFLLEPEVKLTFSNGATYVTTDINGARAIMGDRKYMYRVRKWMPLTGADAAGVESLLKLCVTASGAPEFQATIERTLTSPSVERFLVDSEAITTADIAVYCSLSQGLSSVTQLSPKTEGWLNFTRDTLSSLNVAVDEPACSRTPQPTRSSQSNGTVVAKPAASEASTHPAGTNFIRQIIEEDLRSKKVEGVVTRFPPEPNGFLHLGHAKSICLNFGLARDFKGRCHLRFDDTNPTKEDMRYINSIQEDVKWLGGDWGTHLYYASDYFDQLYEWAVELIRKGLAYVDDQTEEEVRKNRGDVTTPGTNSPYRDRSVEENLVLFAKMKKGEVPEGKSILRAKIDMTHGNMNMRDPPIYRVRFHPHPRTGTQWCIYPIYDFAHGQSDSIEKITHSICTLEFEDHRPLYDWYQLNLNIFKTRQIEFARLNCTYVVMSKRKLVSLVDEKYVNDWDDPRLPTISGMRRKGYPAAAIRDFCERIGVAKRDTTIPFEYLESCVTSALHPVALRRNVVLRPLKVIITNFPAEKVESLVCPNHPENPTLGTRTLHFASELYIDENDFMVTPPPKFFRLCPGGEVRLRHGYWIRCHDYKCDENGRVSEVHCTYDPETKGGNAPSDGRKVKGTLHWVSKADAADIEVRLYNQLFSTATPDDVPEGKVWQDFINPASLQVLTAKGERSLLDAVHPYLAPRTGASPAYFQFERVGFFVPDYDSTPASPIMNLTVPLIDSWAAQTNEKSREAQNKEAAKALREKAALERQMKKERRAAAKTAAVPPS